MKQDLDYLSRELRNIVGEDYVSADLFERISYADTILPYDLDRNDLPDVVVHPGNTQEVAAILSFANKNRIPVTTHGSGTSLIFGTKPKHKGITMSTRRLNFLKIDEDCQWFEAGGGTTLNQIIVELEKMGYILPINTGSRMIATIGGAVGVNTIGHLTDNVYGRPTNNVLSLEAVLPTGEIINTGSKSLRRPAGWDLTRILVGSEGILGVITKVRMVFYPKPETCDAVGFFQNVEEIGKAVGLIYRKKVPLPLDGEFVSEKCAKIGCEAYGLDFPDGPMAITRSMGRTMEEALSNSKEIVEVFKNSGATKSYVLENEKIRRQAWQVRENAMRWGQEKGKTGALPIEVNPPLSRLPEAMRELNHITEGRDDLIGQTEAYLYGHIGSDSLHCQFTFPPDWNANKMKRVVREIWKLEKELNIKYDGIGGDWGQLPYRVPFYREKYGQVSYEIIRKIKKVFDPNNILNRGNLEGEI